MAKNTFELPLTFDSHRARLVVTPHGGGWHVQAEVDHRVLGWEQFALRIQVDHFRARMQQWLTQAEARERRLAEVA